MIRTKRNAAGNSRQKCISRSEEVRILLWLMPQTISSSSFCGSWQAFPISAMSPSSSALRHFWQMLFTALFHGEKWRSGSRDTAPHSKHFIWLHKNQGHRDERCPFFYAFRTGFVVFFEIVFIQYSTVSSVGNVSASNA